ncbi:hypothetical protein XH94_06365 [Bradyrhizobium zhanjiangense]|uniref:Uncharacterized protein n=2 Tax=Bradyrhizobium zhanjiangense TaxID=1325107 RepID=A0A4Q0SP58_9BRAD|nr:hypothetical protein [Bradyrhizobium zhanjiangense]RXH41695.1 hypothetical protein XH94_06365 [Bradyrhizobium zhanjiangense]
MTLEEKLARLRTYRNNIHRYHRLLKTRLSDLEREYIESRLSEEREALASLARTTFLIPFKMPEQQPQTFKPEVA